MTTEPGTAKPPARVPAPPKDAVTERLLSSRLELLDLSLRNPLLNYRPSTRRGVETVDEKAGQVFTWLVAEREPLRFHATKASAARPTDPSKDLFWVDENDLNAGTVGVGEENPPNSLATPYTKEALARRLLETHYDAWLTLQEQGANTLFLTLGMLRWRESDEATQDRWAPLVLVPARLDRKSARSFWQLSALDEDSGVNLSLVEKLKEFGVKMPAAPDFEGADSLERYMAGVAEAVSGRTAWAVERDRVVLGFFSFGKFLMYRDLDPELWPRERHPRDHEVLSGVLVDGFRDRGAPPGPGDDLDARRPAGTTMEVVDADSSQAEALAEVAAGRHLVIQGPPGTGKSQTISNMIAEAVFAGKRVLFVAEKMAALEVVKRRLENIGLGELCLELHSNKASKRDVAADLSRTLAVGKPEPAEGAELVDGLPALRERLNRYARGVAQPVGTSGVTPFQAVGVLVRLKGRPEPLPKLSFAPMAEWTREVFARARTQVQDLAAKVADIGVPRQHPFEGCGLQQVLPDRTEEAIAGLVREAGVATLRAAGAAAALAACFGANPPPDPAALDAGCRLADVTLQAPDLRGVPAVGPEWDRPENAEALAAAADALRSILEVRQAFDAKLTAEAWNADVGAARRDLVAEGGSWWSRLFSGKYRAARRTVQGLCTLPVPKRQADLVAAADAILKSQRLRDELADRADACTALLGERFRGVDSKPEELRALREWGLRFRGVAKRFPAAVGTWVVGLWDREALVRALAAAKEAGAACGAAWARAGSAVAFPCDHRPALEVRPFEENARRAQVWIAELGKLPGYAAYWKLNREVSGLGLAELAGLAHDGAASAEALPLVLDQARAAGVLDRAFRERAELREFDAVTHEQAVQRFRRADASTFPANRVRLAELHWRSLPGNVGYGQVGLLRRESAKKTRHLPIRRLMEQAGDAIQSIKPVFLMSPLSVASYLPPGGPTFDLIIFDEASQVKPVDAFGALLRGRQLVVVGDDKQLPPTSFFEVMLSEAEAPEGDEGAAPSATQDLQSVLELCEAKGMPSRMLRWHYRSRHDSLIALSNREFYENRLVIFPSPSRAPEGEGLSYRYLPETAYERGASRSNPKEADAVARAVLEHAKTRPPLSLGVVAFSQQQREAIEARVEALSRKNAELDAFVNAPRDEPFFVKNLENVQGDERDVMMISVGYGRDAQGGLSMNFGPLNQSGGERRLNVLITRARRQCVVFTNLQPDDLDLRRAPGAGVRAFKAFLAFARDGRLEVGAASEGDAQSEFEVEVRAALVGRGYAVETQVGSGGYRLDLAVADPSAPGRYFLGIECDGSRYHGARWARDRDRLREAVLRDLGWKLHRIWSADWYRNREEALRRCVGAIEEARAAKAAAPGAAAPVRMKRAAHVPPPGREPVPPYKPAKTAANVGGKHLADVDPAKLAEFAAAIADREGPLHVDELRRRILDTVEARPGSKRLAAIDEALGIAAARGFLRRRGDFLWPKEDRPVVPRDRSDLPDASRSLDGVCDEECRAALLRVIEEACGSEADEAAGQAVRLLGVKRNDEAHSRLVGLLEALVREGVLARKAAGLLTVPRP